ncbi:putative ATP-binding cassette protein subfamily G member 5 [Leptomonas pyrrhocoris]|uniref:Putative ATP-binding cassette protein subfamily G member 5 n=1 Tax=Leptomonas pyrrhocoris TaxID=157538 RepID=A0A0N0DYF0_LEPPY|nr:putative ATP-binding cassette protein subfamily G member 5 [Leptomonas pyrrhocoris]KPA84085.1 putative ATP-binding cassette protein subfamily G member 5 [Leptomonas pyrrhocoris]|eukprot:XP_015662524.1 putative ATP-binding cassette protein subfamily G member 5 [Leptomonas pyrrhocoris]
MMSRVPRCVRLLALALVFVALLVDAVCALTAATHHTFDETDKWTAADLSGLNAASSDSACAKCFNGGVWDGEHCTCPLYYTSANCSQRQCPNSVGGKGAHRVLPVNEANKYCDHCDQHDFRGMSCQLCQNNVACRQYAGAKAVCDNSLAIRGNNKQFQCTLQNDFFLRLMGGKRNITAEILLNCSTPDGSAFSKNNTGVCNMAIYRMEPNHSYIDPFFRCDARQCTQRFGEAPTDPDSMNNNTLRQRFFRAAKTSGQVALVVECALLALLGCFTHILGPRRTKTITIRMASLITVTVLVYIALMILSMVSFSTALQTSIYDCKKTECACAEDPPSVYDPICSQSRDVKAVLAAIQNSIRLTCGQHASQCELTLSDLDIVFQADCRASECVDPDLFPDTPSGGGDDDGGGGVSVLARQNLGILLCLLVLLVAGAVGIHYKYTRSISHERGKEFLVTFHVSTPYDEEGNTTTTTTTGRFNGRSMGRTVVDDNSVSLLGGGPADTRANAADSGRTNDDEAEEGTALLGGGGSADSTPSAPHAERVALLPRRASSATRGSRRADSTVSVRASVYEQASALTPEECAQIDRLRRLTAAPLELRVSELRYTLNTPLFGAADEMARRDILHRINFTVHSGDVLAIMGPSGAGKTTLLDLLSARAKSGVVGGSIALNGTAIHTTGAHAAQYRNIVGYVSQEDTLLPSLTVEQTIFYAAKLKLPTALSPNTVRRVVRRIIETLKLQHCAQTLIGGDTTRGISGGEKRRVSIAVELLANPRILYLDEPTSGLDTVSAKRVIEAVVELAKDSPMRVYAPHYFAFRPIVIFSIHQPSQEIYELFDKVLLLSRGMSIYCGSAAAAAATIEQRVTAAFGHTRDVPRKESHNNQAEYVMKVEEMLDDAVRAELQEEDALENATNNVNNENGLRGAQGGVSPNAATTVPPCRTPGSASPRTPSRSASRTDLYAGDVVTGEDILSTTFGFRMYYANTYQQLHLLISRSLTCLVGSFHLVMCHSAVVACLATLMCVLYHQQALDLPGSLNRAGSVSFLLLVTSFVSLSCLEQLILERKLFNVERENGFYTTWPYLISKIVVDIIPLRIVPAMVLASVIYFPMGFRVDAGIHFFYFILIIVLFSICITMMILCIGIVSGSFGAAALLSSVFILWNFVFGGALVQSETIPTSLRAFKSLSPFFLAFEPLMVNELNEQRCVFSPTDETGKQSSASIEIMCRQYLANVGLKPERFNADVMQLAVYCLFFVGLAWVLLSTCSKLVR